ncbi:GTPase-associated system all-helical protein GASH [Sorangium sp. So ce726]|uniref:hypothetical protein n=1 Tax=Sorangium sp. So ce726 TaxID=3133319 RepID=UPI003F622EE2
MTTDSGDRRDRLSEIWTAWGLTPDETTSQAQHRALDVVSAWLGRGKSEPEMTIRAVQILLADPERPDARRRACWAALRKALADVWASAGTGADHVFYGQALLVAAWPHDANEGGLTLPVLLDSAWDVMRGRERQRSELDHWRTERKSGRLIRQHVAASTASPKLAKIGISPFGGMSFPNTQSSISHIESNQSHGHVGAIGPQLVQVLKEYHGAMEKLSAGLVRVSQETARLEQHTAVFVETIVQQDIGRLREEVLGLHGELDLLWWGQARYCRGLRMPYRRMKSNPDALLWWAAIEAAELSLSVNVEPAAAYLVEMLNDLGQEVSEQKSVIGWMEGLRATLASAGDKALRLSEGLDRIASIDPLGLPVTWTRRQTARQEPLTTAGDVIGLNLDEKIDRGQWVSWIFREALLDLYLEEL